METFIVKHFKLMTLHKTHTYIHIHIIYILKTLVLLGPILSRARLHFLSHLMGFSSSPTQSLAETN